MLTVNACPACGSSWIGKPIPKDQQQLFGGETHYSRCIGFYDDVTDRTVAYRCPDCEMFFERPTMRPWPDFDPKNPVK